MTRVAVLFIVAYLAGSVSFSIVLFKILGKDDPRNMFSGSAGAVNVYRQAGFFTAALVLLLDMARAMGVALAATLVLASDFVPWICLGLILGNRFPCFHDFRGGKGVANFLGFTLVVAPVSAVISMPAWLIAYRLFGFPFIASLVMVLILAFGTLNGCGYRPISGTGVLITTMLVCYNHKRNIHEFMQKM
ncbi:MAG: glycerol-3-phosphate acyltransferase [Desulfobacteraceae bacterium]|nr:glycerol-3-phosphate acyltransferase [Desulfobacteraceae bacterium]